MSMFFGNSILGRVRILMDKAGGDGGSGGGGGGTGGDGGDKSKEELAALKTQNADLLARLEKLEKGQGGSGGGGGGGKDEDDLAEKARKEAEAKAKTASEQKRLEGALKFNLTLPQWVKDNASVLPKSIEGIMAQAAKETYADGIEQASTLKVSIVSEFFAQQANLDLLTAAQKDSLDEWKKLTKTEKQARVQQIFDNVFEPTFESLKRQKKAEALNKGFGESTGAEDAYKEKMREISKKHYGVK
ncbi:hypothetical protein BdPhPhi1402_gp14 [Bdellovibrio phage phi1402]|uniref:hypothetical protein n=1 Tax=Bdellovibrio phage phi1402 TaxID=1035662 RepID=UPI000211A2CC|nr:hypothetical protein BdPhPhi1402_gp14 [Bdellovibrio phage phi1402]AEG42311.1 hypothetical protein [Bdellovibrio phage phi1402]